MPFYLRKIRSARWDIAKHDWLSVGDLPADVLGDLATSENVLSVWQIEDDRSNLEDVIVALATGPNITNLSNFDFCLVDQVSVETIGISVEHTRGDTLYQQVNETWHRDLVKLSVDAIRRLAEAFANGERSRRTRSQMQKIVQDKVNDGHIEWDQLPESIQVKLSPPRNRP